MRRASRGIVIKDNNLLVMHRNKFGTEYDTLPGGNVEAGGRGHGNTRERIKIMSPNGDGVFKTGDCPDISGFDGT